MPGKSLYKVLQVDPAADIEIIEAAHRVLIRKLDPDHDATGVAEYRVKELNRALSVLSDPEQRQAYDQELAEQNPRIPVGPGHAGSLAERIYGAENDELRGIRIDFGRYAGWTLGDLLRADPDYLRWLSRHSSGVRYRGAIMKLLAEYDQHRHPLRVIP
jgi:curved DNA-binding protein CbpA